MSCADVQTIQAGNGSTTQFSFDFPYLFKSEIEVSFWNATTKEWDVKATTDATYPWQVTDANPTIVEFTSTAPPSPTTPTDPGEPTVDNVRIRRVTNIDDIRALFSPGSAIRSDDLNKNFEQLRYAIQEAGCQGIPEDIQDYLENYYWDRFDNTIYEADAWVSDDTKIATTAAMDARYLDDSDDTISRDEQIAGSPAPSDVNVFSALAAARRFDNFVQNEQPTETGLGMGRVWVDVDDDLTLSVWNGSQWLGITSGGTFTNQPKVVYVDASSGDDSNDGHRISRPKATIKAAINQINGDATYGDGSVVIVAAGVYQEAAPIQIQKKNVSIIGQALRSCIVHPTVATETNTLFEVNSGSYVANLTLTGMKAGTGTGNTLDPALPTTQGWNFAFYSGATITKSPYIQNCTNFSDSEIDNSNLNANNPAGGAAGDTDSAPTGGGLLVNGATVSSSSPLRSMVCDSYTHVGLNGPGILVTNNGYAQCTSSYAFFNKYHIKCLNGGQANLAASTTDFGDQALVADGRSTTAIFTAALSTAAGDGDITFTIGAPTADASWHGTATRPATNMLVELNSVIYPILSATANGAGWDVTISRPNPSNRSENLGLNGAVSTPATASFFLRSMIASSGHTMEYVGSGTDYRALPENGGVPDETKQITESNNGKVWTAITDHNGKFKIGGNQTTDPIFEVDQQLGFVTIPEGSIAFNLLSDQTPQLGGDLDANGNDIILDTGAAATPSLTFDGDTNTGIYSPAADTVGVSTGGTERIRITSDGKVGIGTTTVVAKTHVSNGSSSVTPNASADELFLENNGNVGLQFGCPNTGNARISFGDPEDAQSGLIFYDHATNHLRFDTAATERVRIDSSGNVGIGTASPSFTLDVNGPIRSDGTSGGLYFGGNSTTPAVGVAIHRPANDTLAFVTASTERARFDSSGRLLVGTTSNSENVIAAFQGFQGSSTGQGIIAIKRGSTPSSGNTVAQIRFNGPGTDEECAFVTAAADGAWGTGDYPGRLSFSTTPDGSATPVERLRISSSGLFSAVSIYNNTTGSAANVVIRSDGVFERSTSSVKYKTDIEDLQNSYADAILECRPIWYRSTCSSDDPSHSWWGFLAEEVAEIDPRLVHWKTFEVSYDENGSAINTQCEPEPDGVAYDRFVPHLLNLIKRQGEAIAELQAEVAALKGA